LPEEVNATTVEVGSDGDFLVVEAVVGVDDLPVSGIGIFEEIEIQAQAA
jgi:hypothetical protein